MRSTDSAGPQGSEPIVEDLVRGSGRSCRSWLPDPNLIQYSEHLGLAETGRQDSCPRTAVGERLQPGPRSRSPVEADQLLLPEWPGFLRAGLHEVPAVASKIMLNQAMAAAPTERLPVEEATTRPHRYCCSNPAATLQSSG